MGRECFCSAVGSQELELRNQVCNPPALSFESPVRTTGSPTNVGKNATNLIATDFLLM